MPAAAPDTPRKMLPPPMTSANLDAKLMDRADFFADARHHGRVEAVVALAHQRLAGHFQEDAAILQIG